MHYVCSCTISETKLESKVFSKLKKKVYFIIKYIQFKYILGVY